MQVISVRLFKCMKLFDLYLFFAINVKNIVSFFCLSHIQMIFAKLPFFNSKHELSRKQIKDFLFCLNSFQCTESL